MKRFITIFSLLLALLMTAGCTASGQNEVAGPTKQPLNGTGFEPVDRETLATALPNGVSLEMAAQYWEELNLGGGNPNPVSYDVFTDYAEFNKAFGGRDLNRKYNEKTFEDIFIVAVHVFAPTGGWSFNVTEGIIRANTVKITIEGNKPSGMVTQAFEEHVLLIAFDRTLYKSDLAVDISAPEFTKPVDDK